MVRKYAGAMCPVTPMRISIHPTHSLNTIKGVLQVRCGLWWSRCLITNQSFVVQTYANRLIPCLTSDLNFENSSLPRFFLIKGVSHSFE